MTACCKSDVTDVSIAQIEDITIGELVGSLADHATRPLVFVYGGRSVQPGYHVTEVKTGRFEGLDCGANPESWTEIFVQLWDVNEDRTHMPARKFAAIIGKVSDHVDLDPAARLTFEVSDGVAPMQLYRASSPRIVDGALLVELSPRPASCKPRDRWLEATRADRPAPCCA